MEILRIVAQLLAATAVVALTVGLSAYYFRRIILRMRKSHSVTVHRMFENLQHQKNVKSKEKLVYNILHDVQAVHQGVDGYVRVIMDSDLTLPQDEWDMLRDEVKRKSHLLRDLVDGAIELLQYENLADVPCEDTVVVNEFCQDMFAACERYLKNENLDLVFETTLTNGFIIKTNVGYLRKLLKNLLVCAMEYTSEGFIKLMVTKDAKHRLLKFDIRDTGLGIPENVKETVFDQLPDDDNISNRIVGVRLRMCRVLTHLLGGTIYIDPNYTKGTSVKFSIAI